MHINPKSHTIVLTVLLAVLMLQQPTAATETSSEFPTDPITNKGRKWRIGYYEGGPYVNYPINLKALAQGLAELHWLDRRVIARIQDTADARVIWDRLVQARSACLRFVSSAYWSANWDDDLREKNQAAALEELQAHRLDFVIAMGTWAGQDLANDRHAVPTMVVSSSDPVKSKIIKSAFDSGFDHVHARCDPDRYMRQIRLFHDITGFKRLGIVYEDSLPGRTYAAIEDLETVAAQRGFTIIPCEAPWSGIPPQTCTQGLIDCHQVLATQIDALFLTVHRGVDPDRMDEILQPLIANAVPTWSQRGPKEVRQGVLISIARGGAEAIGRYHAEIMAMILNGATPRNLNQIFEDPKKIVINLKTASQIGFSVPRGLLQVADEIYK